MNLFFDIGNSRCKYVTHATTGMSALQYIALSNLTVHWLSTTFKHISDCYLADVANSEVKNMLSLWCKNNHINFHLLESQAECNGVRCAYQLPKKFGVDRWLTLLGTHYLFPSQHCLIVDTGTATTVDYLDNKGQHHGGWILAGISTLVSALVNDTANVAAEADQVNTLTLADNTASGVNHGALAATVGMVQQAHWQITNLYNVNSDDLKIVITGGNGKLLQDHLPMQSVVDDKLVFIGIKIQIA